ncbi:uncharacterized protein BCR38DRAFT_470277 [Pseudomassariella vexata]|uniref:Uncharacterized protein n=1 Tax=Pseudomassariella vexata TaxID=1141098 RepID=A0A1Y2EI76_9PEZI|nr:uncharacterized protein BCR38DRAFT_470277 [Pseudomassariella vexata]ORY71278.1 hypothetical protein BCR38DRAFT_470277 [Pseudomassariella vexata]
MAQRRRSTPSLSGMVLVSECAYANGTVFQLSKRVYQDYGLAKAALLSSRDNAKFDEFAKRDGVPVATRTVFDGLPAKRAVYIEHRGGPDRSRPVDCNRFHFYDNCCHLPRTPDQRTAH